jgi:hypothetical protein
VKLISLFGLHWDIIAEMTGMQLSLFTFSFHGLARARKMRPTGEFEPRLVGAATEWKAIKKPRIAPGL